MEEKQIYEKLASVMGEVLGLDGLKLSAEMTANDVEGWDSLSHIRIVLSVEESFGIHFSTVEIPELRNVGEFVALIKSKIS